MYKTKITITLLLSIFVGLIAANVSAIASETEITVIVDGQRIDFDVPPVIVDGRVMAEAQPIAEAMGWSYSENEFAVYLQNHGLLELVPGNLYYTYYKSTIGLTDESLRVRHHDSVGGVDTIHFNAGHYPVKDWEVCTSEKPCIILDEESTVPLTVVPTNVNGKLLVALRDIVAAMYATVEWNSDTGTATITSGKLPFFDGEGLPDEYRYWLLEKTLVSYAANNPLLLNDSSEDEALIELKAEVIRLINEARIQEGLQPLETNPELDTATQLRAEELLEKFSHTRPNGEHESSVYDTETHYYNGENISISMLGKNGASAATMVVGLWMNSPGHRKNIMRTDSVYIGIGAVRGPNSTVYCALGFVK